MKEPELIQAARSGDRPAMAALIARHAPAAQRLALHLTRNRADAEDAVQSGFVKAFTHLDRFDTSRPFEPWLLRIVGNEARKTRRDEGFHLRFWQSRPRDEQTAESPESAVIVTLEHQSLHRAIQLLRHDDRLLITLAYFLDRSEAELAETLGIPRGTVKSRKHNALRRLRAAMSRLDTGAEPETEPEVNVR